MKTLFLTATLFATPVIAGGPVIVEEAYEAEPVQTLTPGEKIAIAAGIILVGALIFGGNGGGDAIDCACNDQPEDGGGSCTC